MRGSSGNRAIWTSIFAICLIATLAAGQAAGGELSQIYNFEAPEIHKVVIGGTTYDRIVMKDAPNYGHEGHPSLPAAGARILIPYGTEVIEVETILGEPKLVADHIRVEPAGLPVKLSADPSEYELPTEDPLVYMSNSLYPGETFESVGQQTFRGYQILHLKLQPVHYLPSEQELYYYDQITVVVRTAESDQRLDTWRGLTSDQSSVLTRVDNPEVSRQYPAATQKSRDAADMVIITTATLAPYFQPLADYHNTNGLVTEIRTTDEIGSTSPDEIRSYIKDRYLADGIEYALIGADDNIIPAKDLWVEAWGGGDIETAMPSDVYFGCLDGTYNFDGDAYWGEPNDGIGGGDVDLVAEVYIGRASVGDATEATRFVNKTLWYLTDQHGRPQNVLMVGEHLGFGGVSEYAATMMDQNVDVSSADGYTTQGIPSDMYNVDRLYDQTWPGQSWPQSEIISRINAGQHILNHLGHGSPDYAMKLYNSTVSSLSNTDLCFLYSQTCLAGHLDGTDCFAEYMNIKTDHGAFAVCMNARYGWGSSNSTDGPSQRFNREFWDAVYNPAEGKPEIGKAQHDSKEDNLYRVNESCMRWIYYEQNLFGDPTVAIKGVAALGFEIVSPLPETVLPNETTTIEVTVVSIGDGVQVPGSGKLHYSLNGDPWTEVAMTAVTADSYEATLPALACDDNLTYRFSATEATYGEFYDVEEADGHTVFAASAVDVVMSDDFETATGWTVSGDAGDGQWNRGVPVGGGDRGDPANDFDGSGQCFLTDNVDGNSDVDDGTTILTSPTIDMSAGDAEIHYARWYSNDYGDDPHNDVMQVYISDDDGANWVLVETVGPVDEASGGWYEHSFSASQYVTPTSQIKMRFDVSDLSSGSVVEAAIDDFSVTIYECVGFVCGDIDGDDESATIADLVYLATYMFNQGPPPAAMGACDVNASGGVPDIEDLVCMVSYMFEQGPPLVCQ